jgi:Zn-dependent protease
MGLISLLSKDPLAFFILVPVLLYSVISHEVAHGWVAYIFGDNTAKDQGRLSFNPKSHIDPMGALAVLLFKFGWAKPVPVSYARLSHSKIAIISVALAGCFANILIATVALFLLQFEIVNANKIFMIVLENVLGVNIILASLNLIPIPPLDGSRVLMSFLSQQLRLKLAKFEPYGFFLVITLLLTGMLDPVIYFIMKVIYLFIGLLI